MNDEHQPLTDSDYQALASFRSALRRFMAFSERAAVDHGLTPHQHQLLLAIRGFASSGAPSISDLAETLQLRLHSVGELADRAAENDLVERHRDPNDSRRALLSLTEGGHAKLEMLSRLHRTELRIFQSELSEILSPLAELHDPLGDEADPPPP